MAQFGMKTLLSLSLPALLFAGHAEASTVSFATPGAATWTVPAGVTSIAISAYGAGGGSGMETYYGPNGANGGNGCVVNSTLQVVPGETLSIFVGGGGGIGSSAGSGGGGGGSTNISRNSSVIIVSGGGGGGSQGANSGGGGTGGDGCSAGSPAGTNGGYGNPATSTGGGGGSICAVGAGGNGTYSLGLAGSAGMGGPGGAGGGGAGGIGQGNGAGAPAPANTWAGGGGGGYNGGGSGAQGYLDDAGGGGGGSFGPQSSTFVVGSNAGVNGAAGGDGAVLITYNTGTPPDYAGPLISLDVKLLGVGAGGSVTSAPAGIECGAVCSYQFTRLSKIKLTATPAAGKKFAGWGGACKGRKSTCTVRLDRFKAVTAKFR